MLALLHGKRSRSDVNAARSHDAECSKCHEQRFWSTQNSFVKHERNCKGKKPRAAPDPNRRSNFIAGCSKCGHERTWGREKDLGIHQQRCTGEAPRIMKGWTKV
jgi:hypothetical protein